LLQEATIAAHDPDRLSLQLEWSAKGQGANTPVAQGGNSEKIQ
jgi:hypothetical protein